MNTAPHSRDLTGRLRALDPEELDRVRCQVRAPAKCGHAHVAEALHRCGIREVLTLPGTPVDRVLSECVARGIRVLGFRNQQAAVLAAAAANYAAGRLRCAVVVSAGPAVTNCLTGLLVAHDNGWPVLVLGGRRALSADGMGAFQMLDAVPLFSPVTRQASCPRTTGELLNQIQQAAATAMSGRPGPCYVDLPEDVLDAMAPIPDGPVPAAIPAPEPDPDALQAAVQRVRQARRPLLVLGDGLRWSLDTAVLRTLVEDHRLPFIATSLARGFLPDDHPRCAGDIRREILGAADLVVLAGTRLDWRLRFGADLAPETGVIVADPDPGIDIAGGRAAHRIACAPGRFLEHLAQALTQGAAVETAESPVSWHAWISAARGARQQSTEPWRHTVGDPMSPQQLALALQEFLPPDTFLVAEGHVMLSTAQHILHLRTPVSWLDPGANGIIGAAIPFALGVRLAHPDRPVVALCSDTGFGLSGLEFETAVRHGLSLVAVVVNNGGNTGALRQAMLFPKEHPDRIAAFQPGLHYERIAAELGAHAEWVSDVREVRPALERALGSGRAACIQVSVDPLAPHPGTW